MTLSRFAAALFVFAAATPAAADTRFLAYDASDRVTQALTRGLTLEVERGLFGAVRVQRLISTSARGEARIERGGPSEVLGALPREAGERTIYAIQSQGDGRGLARALCPSADEAWLVLGRVRAGRPLTMQAVGRWPDGQMRHCVGLSYTYRGEWALPPRGTGPADATRPGFTR
jgi:hypothetical protein